mmetsp:Transcript_6309/g.5424  ORF Transcript_6309/g.5424 Transcript_6309/m.5424 type:complete len:102 (+) Transcript_6309:435-740(+)
MLISEVISKQVWLEVALALLIQPKIRSVNFTESLLTQPENSLLMLINKSFDKINKRGENIRKQSRMGYNTPTQTMFSKRGSASPAQTNFIPKFLKKKPSNY